jgi:hypothetical protein
MFQKLLLASAISLCLSACGGGGGSESSTPTAGGSNPTNPSTGDDTSTGGGDTTPPATGETATLSVSSSVQSVDADELTSRTVTFQVDYTGDNTLNYAANASIDALTVTANDTGLTISIDDITDYQEQGEVTVTVSDGEIEDSLTIAVTVSNTSLITDTTNMLVSTANMKLHYDRDISVQNVLTYYYEIGALLGEVSTADANTELALLNADLTQLQLDASAAIDAVDITLTGALGGGTITEGDLASQVTVIEDINSSYASAVEQAIEQARGATSNTVPSIPLDTLFATSGYSVFVGNTELGEFSGDVFTFSSSYEFLQELVAADTAVCTTLIDGEV